MILAAGRFSTQSVLNAALSMSEGVTAKPDSPVSYHRDGWGALWREPGNQGLSIYRDTRFIKESLKEFLLQEIKPDLLAVHIRSATLTHNQGLEYTHPITREGTAITWYMMHNGYLPTVYQKLGLERSIFDSREYFDYIIPKEGDKLPPHSKILEKLESLAPGGSSANAIIVNSRKAYVIHWTPKDTQFSLYFTMHKLTTEYATFIASDIIPDLAPPECWSSLTRGEVLEFSLADTR
jgi:glutamine amidotransferase